MAKEEVKIEVVEEVKIGRFKKFWALHSDKVIAVGIGLLAGIGGTYVACKSSIGAAKQTTYLEYSEPMVEVDIEDDVEV